MTRPDKPGLAYLTSCRELCDSERAGQILDTPLERLGYRSSLLEQIAEGLNREDPILSAFELRRVLVDDSPQELAAVWDGAPVWPLAMSVPGREGPRSLQALMQPVSSAPYRGLRRGDESAQAFADRKALAKQAYERELLQACADIDLLICDSYTLLLGETFLAGFAGQILNVHPGISCPSDPERLPGRTPTRDAFTRAAYGYIIVDDKRQVPLPAGAPLQVEYEGRLRSAVAVAPQCSSGVSVHVLTADVDAGPVVAACRYRFAREGLSIERLRAINYALKPLVLKQALQAYLSGEIAAGSRSSPACWVPGQARGGARARSGKTPIFKANC